MKQYGIIGHPLSHTMSPTLHNWGFEQFYIKANYKAWPVTPKDLPTFMASFKNENHSGLSVTIPHKQAVIPFLDKLTPRAKTVGAVNTLYWDAGVLIGDNTDVAGIVAPIRALGLDLNPDLVLESALILGAGGAARAAAAACQELDILAIGITNRTRSKAEAIASDFTIEVIDWENRHDLNPQLLINTTPLGMCGELEQLSPYNASSLEPETIIFDLVYNPLNTKLLQAANELGCTTIQGLEMFLHQGMKQFKLWTGKQLDEKAARALLLEKLKP